MLSMPALIVLGIILGFLVKIAVDKFLPGIFNKVADSIMGIIFLVVLIGIVQVATTPSDSVGLLQMMNALAGSYLTLEAVGEWLLR